MSFISEILESTVEIEAPNQYIFWSALTAVSAVSAFNVYLNMHEFLLSPNIYTILVGPPGLSKSFAVNIAARLVEAVENTRIFRGQMSIEGMIKDLSMAFTIENENGESREPILDARAFICSDEFINAVLKNDIAISVLTQWYTTEFSGSWTKTLKGTEKRVTKEKLHNLNVSILGASTPSYLKMAIPKEAREGGFLSRTFLVYADKPAILNSLTKAPTKVINYADLITSLKEITTFKGEFEWPETSKSLYDDWFYDYYQKPSDESLDPFGVRARMKTHVLKVAMLLALASGSGLNLSDEFIRIAIDVCETLSDNGRKILNAPGSAAEEKAYGQAFYMIMDMFAHSKDTNYDLSRQDIMRRSQGAFSSITLQVIIESLRTANSITIRKENGQEIYRMRPEHAEGVKVHLESRIDKIRERLRGV